MVNWDDINLTLWSRLFLHNPRIFIFIGFLVSIGLGSLSYYLTKSDFIAIVSSGVSIMIYCIFMAISYHRYKTKDEKKMRDYIDRELNKER